MGFEYSFIHTTGFTLQAPWGFSSYTLPPPSLSTILLATESNLLQLQTWSSLVGFRQELPSQWLGSLEDNPLKASMPCVIFVSTLLS